MENIDMAKELAACSRYKSMGRDVAEENYNRICESLRKEEIKLKDIERRQNYDNRLANDEQILEQWQELQEHIKSVNNEIRANIDELNRRSADFTVVLYGRTMAGKSTLMEILTHGDGKSIGKGAQRTTLDVRPYMWNGLKILDVPGIASFEGEVDDKLAYEAAKTADLAIFLLTDDAPQPVEAARLAELKALGKTLLGVVNIKQVLNANASSVARKMDLKKLTRKMADKERLDEIIDQFNEFGQKNGYDFSDINWVATHLQAAYYSQPERENDAVLYELSNFAAVEEFVTENVRSKGQFISYKTYVDNVAIPMQNIIKMLYSHSSESVGVELKYEEKIDQLNEWRESFVDDIQERYDVFCNTLKSKLNAKVNYVVNNYYDSSNAGDAWKDSINDLHLDQMCQDFVGTEADYVNRKLRSFEDELSQDLRYSGINFNLPPISMEDITDWQGGLMLLAPALAFIPGIGWAGAAVFAGLTWLFGDSKEEKIRKAKNELREKLNESRDDIVDKISSGVIDILNQNILHGQIDGFRDILVKRRDMFKRLAYEQNDMATNITVQYRNLNFELFNRAGDFYNHSVGLQEVFIVRIVGEKFIIFTTTLMPGKEKAELANILNEKTTVITLNSDKYWDEITAFAKTNIAQEDIAIDLYIDESYGKMYVIIVADDDDDKVNLLQQIYTSPVI